MKIVICQDFSETPNARYRSEGEHSGEEFRETLLEPKYLEAKENNEKLVIDFDGSYGYPTSFLEEAFGGLARRYDYKDILNRLDFISNDEPSLVDEVTDYIANAKKDK